MSRIDKYFDISSFFKFIILVLSLYYFSIAFNGMVSPEGRYYSAFLDNYLNYIAWIRSFIINVSNFIAHLFGTNSYVDGPQTIKIGEVIELDVWFPCLGLGIISFWLAFVFITKGPWKKKIIWALIGIVSICIINCWRITLLLVALDNNWEASSIIDHHDLFNLVAYAFIILLMFFYTRKKTSSKLKIGGSLT